MADYEPLSTHAVHKALAELLDLESNDKLSESNTSIEPLHHWSLEHIFYIATQAKLTIERLPPQEASVAALDAITTGLNKTKNELAAFIDSGNAAHINNGRNHVESSVLVQLKRLMPIGFEVHPRTEAALESYKRKVREAVRRQGKFATEFRDEVAELREAAAVEKQSLASLVEAVNSTRAENETLLNELRKADSERVERQTTASNEALLAAEKKLSEMMSGNEKQLETMLRRNKDNTQKVVREIEAKREEARKIVQSVGDLLTTGTYADRANKETSKADQFRYMTVGLFCLGLLIVLSNYMIFAIGIAFDADVSLAESWQSLVARIGTGLAVTLPAFYTARESARHRTNADVAKQRELELTTLGPFIELLPDEQKTAIRDRLTDRYFGGEVDPHEIKAPIDMDGLVRALSEASKRTSASGD